MEKEIIETVLTEILEELRELKRVNSESASATAENRILLAAINQKLQAKQVAKPEINTQSLERLIFLGLERINATIEQKPAAVRREFRILLFPEYNAKEYYRIVFGRLLFWTMVFLITTYFFVLCRQYLEGNYKSKEGIIESSGYKKAWNYLYQNSKKGIRQKMDTGFVESLNTKC